MECPFKQVFGDVVKCDYLENKDSKECTDFYQCPKLHDSWCCSRIMQHLKDQQRSDERAVDKMPRCSEHHKKLDINGTGYCSAPMWRGSRPAGFCDKVAYGVYEGRVDDYQGYVPYLACPAHGGPLQRSNKENKET